MLAGCLATENRKVEITSRNIASVNSHTTLWWQKKYTGAPADNPWNAFIPPEDIPDNQRPEDALTKELKYFDKNVIKWPKKMPPAYVAPKSIKKSSPIEDRLKKPVQLEEEVF